MRIIRQKQFGWFGFGKKKSQPQPKPKFTFSEINKYKNDPRLKWLPKEYWKLLYIELELKPMFPFFGDGDEYVGLYVTKPWDLAEEDMLMMDEHDKVCNPEIIILGDQIYEDIGYYSGPNKWFYGYEWHDGFAVGKTPISNLKQFLIKVFQEDLDMMKRNKFFGWDDDEIQSVTQYNEQAIKLLKTL